MIIIVKKMQRNVITNKNRSNLLIILSDFLTGLPLSRSKKAGSELRFIIKAHKDAMSLLNVGAASSSPKQRNVLTLNFSQHNAQTVLNIKLSTMNNSKNMLNTIILTARKSTRILG